VLFSFYYKYKSNYFRKRLGVVWRFLGLGVVWRFRTRLILGDMGLVTLDGDFVDRIGDLYLFRDAGFVTRFRDCIIALA